MFDFWLVVQNVVFFVMGFGAGLLVYEFWVRRELGKGLTDEVL